MIKTPNKTHPEKKFDIQNSGGKGEQLSSKHLYAMLHQQLPFFQELVVTFMPRGSLQIVQPARVPDALLKSYSREFHTDDRLTWQVIHKRQAMRAQDAWQGENFHTSAFFQNVLEPVGARFMAAAPLRSPVLDGYPGALVLLRTAEQGDFSDDDLAKLADITGRIDRAEAESRAARRTGVCAEPGPAWSHRPDSRLIILDDQLRPQFSTSVLSDLDERLQQQMLQDARQRFHHLNGRDFSADRLLLPDARGDLWVFRVVAYAKYRAIGEGPFVMYCLQPECCEWGVVRPADFQADAELSRLVPALRFMQEHFHRSPTLVEIAKIVHLSPFHFHRRFTELLGLTPKHYLLDCQIFEAKRQLIARQKNLAKIARDCGFAHQSHFTSRFKQATGLTPTRWRRMAADRERAAKD